VHDRALDTVATFLGPRCEALRSLVVASFGFVSPPVPGSALTRAVAGELERFLLARRPRLGRVEPAVRLGTAVAAEVFAEAAGWRADLLVVGTHARHAFDPLALGGTAEACIRDAPCNVLAVPPACPAAIILEAAAPSGALASAPPGP
jgi:nucleotide-binding universal stress UspA family protein